MRVLPREHLTVARPGIRPFRRAFFLRKQKAAAFGYLAELRMHKALGAAGAIVGGALGGGRGAAVGARER